MTRERRSPLLGFVLAAIAGAIVGSLITAAVVHAATSRPASESPVPAQGRTGAPPWAVAVSSPPAEVRESAVGSHPYPDPVSYGGAPFLPSAGSLARTSQSVAGTASWCAPTTTHCQSWGGDAHLAAVPSFSYGDRPYTVIVHYRAKQTTVRVVSYCACGSHAIDLSPAAFEDLAPLGLGSIHVSIERAGPSITPPPTDVR